MVGQVLICLLDVNLRVLVVAKHLDETGDLAYQLLVILTHIDIIVIPFLFIFLS